MTQGAEQIGQREFLALRGVDEIGHGIQLNHNACKVLRKLRRAHSHLATSGIMKYEALVRCLLEHDHVLKVPVQHRGKLNQYHLIDVAAQWLSSKSNLASNVKKTAE